MNNTESKFAYLKAADLKPLPWGNIRESRNQEDYQTLRESIRANGVHTPICVREVDGEQQVVFGYGRWEGCLAESIELIPAIIRTLTDEEARRLQASENSDRESMSIVDEAKAVRYIIADCNGDAKAAAASMGWTEHKMRSCLQILRCSPTVQKAIEVKQENGFTLTLSHAAVLSTVEQTLQDQILPKVILTKMNLTLLKQRVKTVIERPLASAIFDTTACKTCEHNTCEQYAMFESDALAKDLCMNPTCFVEKEQAHTKQRMAELESEYGNVIAMSTVDGQNQPVHEAMIGDNYQNKCLSCSKLATVYVDVGKSRDQVLENQCLNSKCLMSMITVRQQPKQSTAASPVTRADKPQADTAKQTTTEPVSTPKPAAIPKRLTHESQDFSRSVLAPMLLNEHESYANALILATLESSHGTGNITDKVKKYLSLDSDTLQDKINAEIQNITEKAANENCSFNPRSMMLKLAKGNTELESRVRTGWTPTQSRLKDMTKAIRLNVLEESGFRAEFEKTKSAKEYAKLVSLTADSQIAEILKFKFDWTNYCPSYVTDSMK
ncbi:ParB/RepB/Spo0J family partition protein [Photobacterium lutimaris]|uniref:ParB-like N-terminal domain-containing protein n=1 Tax=Photobacterium lutimaris TaxID=388278 RepID=A0A2T3ITJ5_9GAMM|nr:ParB/RepB/Spo0J family partition protein [Photobacterium lutimaris]PSU31661.1 hypothetical protein C9I99_20965 [Photobacterium lutimaris]TDR72705.1 PRTRC genetic system ParB family protein [Photobacterium lutimaris]